jgi:hypothetical protein
MTVIQLKQEDINNTAWAMPDYLAWLDEEETVTRRGTSRSQAASRQESRLNYSGARTIMAA